MAYALRIDPDTKVDLGAIPTGETGGLDKKGARRKTTELGARLEQLQELLFAAGNHALLVILQGIDTSGKDGTIRRILEFTNVQSARVVPFKVPTPAELAHDFLWRVHLHTPAKGEIAVFNRSHYEDVLAVRVHDLVPPEVWRKRYAQINHFERLLASSDTLVVKFFLHISKEEQAERLLAREQDPTKAWKLAVGDWKERELWPEYRRAAEEMLSRCSTDHAPWRVVSANHKWFRDLAVIEALVETLSPFEAGWRKSLEELGADQRALIDEYRSQTGA